MKRITKIALIITLVAVCLSAVTVFAYAESTTIIKHLFKDNASVKAASSIIIGDVNGDGEVNNIDAALILKYDAGLETADAIDTKFEINGIKDAYVDENLHLWIEDANGTKADKGYVGVNFAKPMTVSSVTSQNIGSYVIIGDVNGDGEVNNIDAALILKYDAGLDTAEAIGTTVSSVVVTGTEVDEDYHLWVKLSDGTTIDAGYVGVETYTVIFKDYDGKVLSTVENVKKGESVTAPADPSRQYYTFAGWDEEFTNVTDNLVVTAQYTEITHNVNYYDTKGVEIPEAYKLYSEHAGVQLPSSDVMTAEGYQFKGWYTLREGGDRIDYIDIGTTKDITVYARWDYIKYTITYKDIGNTTNPTEYTVEQEIVLAPAEWSGLAFKNWTNEKGETVTKIEKGSVGDIVLYANWIYEENMAVPSGDSEIKSVVYDAEKNRYYFVYDLGVIDNVVLETIGSNDKSVGMELTLGKSHTTNVEKAMADTVANTISHSISQTEEWSNNFTNTESNEISFNVGTGLEAKDVFKIEASLGVSNSTETSREYGQGGSISGGSETSDSVSSTVSYSVGTSLTIETGYTISGEMPAGTYSYVCVGKVHVYGVVIYDPSDGKYYLDTYSVLDEKLREKVLYEAPSNSTVNISYSEGLPFDAYASDVEIVEKLNSVFYVEYDANGGQGEMLFSVHTIGEQKSLLENKYEFAGHTFMGWSTTKDGSVVYTDAETVGTIASANETITLYAVWQVIPYTVSWDTGVGYAITVERTSSPFANASIGKLSSGEKVYYGDTLGISYTNSVGYIITESGKTSITVNGNVGAQEIFAVARANQYTVEYNANGGSGSTSSTTHTYDQPKALSNNGFTRTGWNFLGWSTSSSATTATYTNGQSVKNLTSQSNGKVTLYAVWTLVTSNSYSFDAFFVNNTIGGSNGYYVDLGNVFDMQSLKNQSYTMNVSMNFSLVSVDVGSDGKYEYSFAMFNSSADTGFKLYETNSSISSGTRNMSYNNVVSIAANQLTNNNLGFLFYENTYSLFGIKTNEYKVVSLVMTVTFTK